MKELYAVVFGNVQGVLFRKFAQTKAEELGISGYAKNMPDGSVEVVAQGKEEDLKKFVSFISVGPEDGEVESINLQYGPIPDGEQMWGFSIE